MNRFVALAMAVGVLIVAGSMSVGDSTSTPRRVLFLTPEDHADPQLRDSIAAFEQAGYFLTQDLSKALRNATTSEILVFMATHRTFPEVPEATWADLYGRHVIVGGLNVSLHELQPLAQGTAPGAGRLRYTPQRAIFSMLYTSSGCGTGATSDWLAPYNVPGIADMRVAQIEPCASK